MKSLFLLFFSFAALSLLAKSTNYTYVDGSGNVYELKGDSLHYIPVKMENSSSGEYSGGDPKSISVSSEERALIESLFKKAKKAKDQHQENREKGTGMIATKKGEGIVLKVDSAAKNELEKALKNVLSN